MSSASKSMADRRGGSTQSNRITFSPNPPITCKAVSILVLLLAVFIAIECLLPLNTAVKIGVDEGYELAKATLSAHGYHFYTEVWNDQPPVNTYLLTEILKHVSPAILWQRLMTVGFAILLLAGMFAIILRLRGLLVAAIATLLMMASPGFIELSSSAMQEIPALAPVLVSLCLLIVFKRNKWRLGQALAGIVFAFTLQMKLIGIIYLPIVCLVLWLRDRSELKQANGLAQSFGDLFPSTFRNSMLVFAVSFGIAFVGIDWLVDRGAYLKHFQESWSAHFAGARSYEYGSPAEHPFDWSVLLKNWDTTVPALIGAVVLARQFRQHPLFLIPLAWLALTLAVFGIHKPWWSYYYVHNAVPLSWCAAVGITMLLQHAMAKRKKTPVVLLTLAIVGALTWMGARVWLQVRNIRQSSQLYTQLVLPEIERFKPFTKFLYTDEPVYSFHSGIPLPPQLGIISLKRFWSGDLTTAEFVQDLRLAEPGLILLENTTREQPFNDWLNTEYRLIYEDSKLRLYASKSLLARARQSGVRP